MKKLLASIVLVFALAFSVSVSAEEPVKGPLAPYLQDVSVTIRSDYGQGSGVIVTRELQSGDKKVKVNFVWTAGHVVDGLRQVRTVIDPKSGATRQVIEFKDASIVKELVEDGRRVGETKMDAKVLKFSDADNGEDLALLMVRKTDFISANTVFHLNEPGIVPIGTQLFHCGSLLGQFGSNSMTTGIMSQVGRVLDLGGSGGKVFDQTTATAFPGSSGGGVFIAEDGKHRGQYCGMLVRGAGETFNLIVPVRRMKEWARRVGVEWALDCSKPAPSLESINDGKWTVEDSGVVWAEKADKAATNKKFGLHFLLGDPKATKPTFLEWMIK